MQESPAGYNAVFKGGGAKGIAYAGALQACEEVGIEFANVAGSSAGAISAVLVACKYTSREITGMMPTALATIGDPMASLVVPARSSLLDSDELRHFLAEVVADKVHEGWRVNGETAPVSTFSELLGATGVSLYVVAMDLATRQPIVFGPELTPRMDISVAVVASSAIPVAFPPVRVVLGGEVHRVVDGGTWANYPAFVFHDRDFRSFHELPPAELPTIGFILDDDATSPTDNRSIVPAEGPKFMSDRGSVVRELGFVGATVSSPVFRWMFALTPLFFIGIACFAIVREAAAGFPLLVEAPDFLESPLLLFTGGTVAVASVIALATSVMALRFGREVSDGGVVGGIAAMGVGPSVPYWVGTGDHQHRHVGIRIPVPEDLTTLQFRPEQSVVDAAVKAGYTATIRALSDAELGAAQLQKEIERASSLPPPPAEPLKKHVWELGLLGYAIAIVSVPMQLFLRVYVKWPTWILNNSRRNRFAWATTLLISLPAAALAISAALLLIINGRAFVGSLILLSSGLLVTFSIWILAARKAALGALPYPSLGKLSTRVLWLIAIIALLLATGVFVLLSQRISVVAIVNSETTAGVVRGVDSENGTAEVHLPLSFKEIDSLLIDPVVAEGVSRQFVSNDILAAVTVDLDDETVRRCSQPPACLIMRDPASSLEDGETEIIHIHEKSGTAFLDKDRNAIGPLAGTATTLFFIAGLVSLAFHCWHVTVWRRSQVSVEPIAHIETADASRAPPFFDQSAEAE